MSEDNIKKTVEDAITRAAPVRFTEEGIESLKKTILDDLTSALKSTNDAALDEFMATTRMCKPHKWLGWGDQTCMVCEREGTDYMESAT